MSGRSRQRGASDAAVITGATGGLGVEFIKQLARQNYQIIAVGRSEEKLEEMAERVRQKGVVIQPLVADLTREAGLKRVEKVFEQGHVKYLVNNAGVGSAGPFLHSDAKENRSHIELNVQALVRLSHKAANAFARRGGGHILNVSSVAAFVPLPGFAVYAATKSFVKQFSLALSEELSRSGVRVAALCPGYVRTPFLQKSGLASHVQRFAMNPEKVVKIGLSRFHKGEKLIVVGVSNQLLANFTAHLPGAVAAKLARQIFSFQMSREVSQ